MSVNNMRVALKSLYNGAYRWVTKVNSMSDKQVVAVYYRMVGSGQLKN